MPDRTLEDVARKSLDAAEDGSLTFPQIVATLIDAGFEGYAVDFRRGRVTYYHGADTYADLPEHHPDARIADRFDVATVRAAILEAQSLAPGYSYAGFCRKIRAGGCAGYHVSFAGRRAVYYGKTGECHVEHFPQ